MAHRIENRSRVGRFSVLRVYVIWCIAALWLGGCTTMTTIRVVGEARVPETGKVRTVAVYPFEGRFGDTYRDEIEALLVDAEFGGRRHFTVVESSRLDAIIRAQRLGAVYDEGTVMRVGKLVGARGVFMGRVTSDSVSNSFYRILTQSCSNTRYIRCSVSIRYPVVCERRIANVGFTIRLVDVETGVQLYNRNVSGRAISDSCRGGYRYLESRDELRRRARQAAYEKIRRDIAPYSVELHVELLDDTDGIESDQAKRKLEAGVLFAKSGRLDRACELWREARVDAPRSVAILYNIGICAEAAGEKANALALYEEADRLLEKPVRAINAALERVRNKPDWQSGRYFRTTVP